MGRFMHVTTHGTGHGPWAMGHGPWSPRMSSPWRMAQLIPDTAPQMPVLLLFKSGMKPSSIYAASIRHTCGHAYLTLPLSSSNRSARLRSRFNTWPPSIGIPTADGVGRLSALVV